MSDPSPGDMVLPDQNAREQALLPTQSFIVQAPAGSGKTGLLVRRILKLLGAVEKPEEILAITFTRKATAEMRKRVIDALHNAYTGKAFEAHEQDMEIHARVALARDKEKQWQLLQQPQRLRIQTIDSLCAELVRKMPWSTRFGGVPQIETDLETLYTRAAQSLIEKIDTPSLQTALGTLLIFSNGDLQILKRQLAGMLYQREAILRLIFWYKALDSRKDIEQHWLAIFEQSIEALEQAFGPGLSEELLELTRYAEQHRVESAAPLTEEQIDALYHASRRPDLNIRALRWKLIDQMLCTTKGVFRKSVNKNDGFPTNDAAKTRMREILTDLQDDTRAQAIFKQFRRVPDPRISDSEWARLQAMKTIIPALAQELYVIMSEHNCADYDELSQRAINALGDPDNPSDLALIQDYRIKHILMDEFQDTSPAQLRLLERLTAGWQSDDSGRSLFLVGDPMQSIYGFRGADVRVFLKVRNSGINDIRPQSLELTVNFRSSPDIVNWVNKTMHPIFPQKDEPALARVKYSASTAHQSCYGSINTHLCIAENTQNAADYRYSEAQQILKHIRALQEQHPEDSIAVLARKRSPLTALAECLRASQTAFEAVDLETLDEQSIIQDLISLCGIFLQPMDTLSWLAVLRAPWNGLSLKDLTLLRELNMAVVEVLKNDLLPETISVAGREALSRAQAVLLPLIEVGRRQELHQRVRRAWLALRGPACFGKHELVHVEPFFEMLIALESEPNGLSRERLHQACKQHKSSAPANTLKLMTFHKAKGLEFDHVILTGLAGKSGGDNRRQPLLYSAHSGETILVAPGSRADELPPTKAGFIKQHHKSIEDEEAARLLYVALTRAKKQLFLFATLKRNTGGEPGTPQQGSLLHLLWPELQADFERPEFQTEASGNDRPALEYPDNPKSVPLLSLASPLEPVQLPADIQYLPHSYPVNQDEIEFSWAQEDARIVGLVIHQLLELADLTQLTAWQKEINQHAINTSLIRFGLISERIENAGRRVTRILQTISNDKRAHWLFDPRHQDIKREWALSCALNGHVSNYVIDRSFVDENDIRWIIDFKTSAHEGGNLQSFLDEEEQRYSEQLMQYGSLAHVLEPDREIRLGLYFPAIAQWRERKYTPPA
ncbi:MAG: UvrD-helicase domain-containing protein [Proteobacteria bacterium]|nr:UvrD-helicase domain-containing protein [Pseudomonadota bacterium]